jgi:hypothetical protein
MTKAEIIYNMPEEEYHSLNRLSASLLKTGYCSGSLSEVRKYMQGNSKSSKALRLGWLSHMRVNCPHEWSEKVRCPEADLIEGILTSKGEPAKDPLRTSSYAKRKQEWIASNPGKIIVTQDELDACESYAFALMRSECYKKPTNTEVTVLFSFHGEPAKCRIDAEIQLPGTDAYDIYDWKFVRTVKDFGYQIHKYGWHLQAAFYKYAYEEAGRIVRGFHYVGIDKTNPYPEYTVCAPMCQDFVADGMQECINWQYLISKAKKYDYWPASVSPQKWEAHLLRGRGIH